MSTRSLIGLVKGNKVEYIYCHNDGYVQYNGVMLKTYYKTQEQVQALLNMCDISSLGAIATTNDEWLALTQEQHGEREENGARKYTLSYNNWRNEGTTSHEVSITKYLGEYMLNHSDAAYFYYFLNGEWHCRNWRGEEVDIPNMEDLEDE